MINKAFIIKNQDGKFLHFLVGEIVTIEQIYIFPKRTI